jgi:hypothetical protein
MSDLLQEFMEPFISKMESLQKVKEWYFWKVKS